jgi:DinB family protein
MSTSYEPPVGLPSALRALLGTTHDRHEDMTNLVRGLPEDALAWTPAEGASAMAGIVLHILDVESYLASVATGEDIGWTGERGSHIHDRATEAALVAAIEDVDTRVKRAFGALTTERFESSIGAALVEDLDHVAGHLGQLQLTRNLYEAAHPDAPRTYEHWR